MKGFLEVLKSKQDVILESLMTMNRSIFKLMIIAKCIHENNEFELENEEYHDGLQGCFFLICWICKFNFFNPELRTEIKKTLHFRFVKHFNRDVTNNNKT